MNSVVVTCSIAFIAGITPTNYSVSYIVKNSTHKSESIATAIYDNKQSDCLLSRPQRLIGL